MKERFRSLTLREVQRIVDNIDRVCLDTYNYDAATDKYCPLAIAKNLHNRAIHPSNSSVSSELGYYFYPVNRLKGVKGTFYRRTRKADLLELCEEVIQEKHKELFRDP